MDKFSHSVSFRVKVHKRDQLWGKRTLDFSFFWRVLVTNPCSFVHQSRVICSFVVSARDGEKCRKSHYTSLEERFGSSTSMMTESSSASYVNKIFIEMNSTSLINTRTAFARRTVMQLSIKYNIYLTHFRLREENVCFGKFSCRFQSQNSDPKQLSSAGNVSQCAAKGIPSWQFVTMSNSKVDSYTSNRRWKETQTFLSVTNDINGKRGGIRVRLLGCCVPTSLHNSIAKC